MPLKDIVNLLDGLVLQGGVDISPEMYGSQPQRPEWAGDPIRDRYELDLLQGFIEARKPVLGVCRGAQRINVFHGGTLLQDIPSQWPGAVAHQDTEHYDQLVHDVAFEPSSGLARWYGGTTGHRVNSIHHQCVDRLGEGLVVEARSPADGVVEAIRRAGPDFVLGVQWHPEFHLTPQERARGLLDSGPMMQAFLDSSRDRSGRPPAAAVA